MVPSDACTAEKKERQAQSTHCPPRGILPCRQRQCSSATGWRPRQDLRPSSLAKQRFVEPHAVLKADRPVYRCTIFGCWHAIKTSGSSVISRPFPLGQRSLVEAHVAPFGILNAGTYVWQGDCPHGVGGVPYTRSLVGFSCRERVSGGPQFALRPCGTVGFGRVGVPPTG